MESRRVTSISGLRTPLLGQETHGPDITPGPTAPSVSVQGNVTPAHSGAVVIEDNTGNRKGVPTSKHYAQKSSLRMTAAAIHDVTAKEPDVDKGQAGGKAEAPVRLWSRQMRPLKSLKRL